MTDNYEKISRDIINRHSEPFKRFKIKKTHFKMFEKMDKLLIFELLTQYYTSEEKETIENNL